MSHEFSGAQESISVHALGRWRQENTPHQLLDVREAPELAICAVEGAVHIPMGQVPARMGELRQDLPLVVMCHHGMRSQRVAQFLRNSGWENAINLAGGIDAWAIEVDATIPRY